MSLTFLSKAATASAPTFPKSVCQTQKCVPDDATFVDGTSSGNMYYCSYSHFQEAFSVGLHPHAAFEIHTYVVSGVARHYDTSIETWVDLSTGALQVMRTGSGMKHAEKIAAGCRSFQIWFTTPEHELPPERHQTPSYSVHPPLDPLPAVDCSSSSSSSSSFSFVPIVGPGSPVLSSVPGLSMCRLLCKGGCIGESPLPLPPPVFESVGQQVGLLFVLEGQLDVKETKKGGRRFTLQRDDAIVLRGGENPGECVIALEVSEGCDLFYVSTPATTAKKKSGFG